MAILADVAPYSREYHTYRQKVGSQAQGNTELEIEYEKILTRVKKTRESVIKMNDMTWVLRLAEPKTPSRARAGSPAATPRSITRLGSRLLSTRAQAAASISVSPSQKPTLPSQKPAPFPSSENSQIRQRSGHRSWWPNLQPKRRGNTFPPTSIGTYGRKECVLAGFFPA
jgi:hypothetical protein